MPFALLIAAIAAQAPPARAVPPPRLVAPPLVVAPPRVVAPAVATEASDGRCLVAFAAVGAGGTPEQQNAAKLGALYFYGKLVGRNPRLDLVAVMRASATAVRLRLQAEIVRCGGELEVGGAAMQAAGATLDAGRASPPRP